MWNKKLMLLLLFSFSVYQEVLALDLNDLDKLKKQADQNLQQVQAVSETVDKTKTKVIETKEIIKNEGISENEEIEIGRVLSGRLLGATPLVKDEKTQNYVNRLGRWLSLQSERKNLPWHFGVIESEDLNAFSAPGGYVFVTKGLIKNLQSESELAAVLSHEISHIVKRHYIKILLKQKLLGEGSEALKQKLAKEGASTEVVSSLLGNGAELMARKLDKDSEYEADKEAVQLVIQSGYEPYGLFVVLQRLAQVSNKDSRIALLFKTHPSPKERLASLEKKLSQVSDKGESSFDGKVRFEKTMLGSHL